jgi:hypothetical protein
MMQQNKQHGLQMINRYSGLAATVVYCDFVTDTVMLKLSGGQEAEYSILDINQLWLIKNPPTEETLKEPEEKKDTENLLS